MMVIIDVQVPNVYLNDTHAFTAMCNRAYIICGQTFKTNHQLELVNADVVIISLSSNAVSEMGVCS